ncbi:uncharacterized protein [Fopius arisanus]|uniref:Uncharacterized protein n=1 Tax=Fopius arisanus TaxID=64838 RepID=A0A9R1TM71_9HYME|nr:PREDICTED: uncharacterized protein LOC105272827 [Fopius arisanus]
MAEKGDDGNTNPPILNLDFNRDNSNDYLLPRDDQLKDSPQPKGIGLQGAINQKMKQLNRRVEALEELYVELKQMELNLDSVKQEVLDTHEKIIEQEWSELNQLQERVIEYIPENHPFLTEDKCALAEKIKRESIKLIGRLKSQIPKSQDSSNSTTGTSTSTLSRIILKPFDGKREKWREWSALFWEMVGSKPIPEVEKLTRLKGLLQGPVENLLTSFEPLPENFEKAWAKLKRKFEDPRLVAQALFNQMLDLPTITRPTEENITTNASTIVETLDQLQQIPGLNKEDIIEQLCIHLLRKSLDSDTRKQWEVKLGDSKDFPSLTEFVTFIEAWGRGINAGANLYANQTSKPTRTSSTTSRKRSSFTTATQQKTSSNPERPLPKTFCAFCQDKHFIAGCDKFKALTPLQRNNHVVNKELCFRCLGPDRKIRCISTKTCHKCHQDHHTLIHGGSPYSMSPTPVAEQSAVEPPKRREEPEASTSSE